MAALSRLTTITIQVGAGNQSYFSFTAWALSLFQSNFFASLLVMLLKRNVISYALHR